MSTDTHAAGQVAAEQALSRLHRITSSGELDFEQRVDSILHLGAEHFGLPIAIFSKIDDETYEVQQAIHPEGALKPGMSFELENTYCSHVVKANDVRGFHHVADSEIQTHPCYKNFALEAYLGAPIIADGVRFGTLNFSSPEPTRPFTGQDIELVRLFAAWVGNEIARRRDLRELEVARTELERLATTDPLTGLYNRRYMENCLTKELERAKRYGKSLIIGLLDFDDFKELNDNYGHTTGDAALRLFAKVSSDMMRETDVIARWGDEEFLILMPETGAAGALKYLQRLSDRVRESDFQAEDARVELTMSIGLGIAEADDTLDSLVSRADIAMYEAKQAGRNVTKLQNDR
ncbi:diguanylate cyclase [Thalassospira lucentensis]|uniref:sensor domain-containing diguanylate cyclase n=1 Tax=Thalassospira lucentensis TaxID=168935 RepID=UPI003AA992F6